MSYKKRYPLKTIYFQTFFNVLFNQRIDDGEARNADEHTDESEKTGHDGDGNDDPDGRKSRGSAVDTGNDDITVDLLNDQDHNGERDGVRRLANEKNDCAGDCAEERTENRNDIGNGNDHTDQRSIGHTCDLNEKETDKTNEQGIKKSGDEIFSECTVCQRNEINNFFVKFLTEKRFHDFFGLCANVFLCAQEINSKDETEKNIQKRSRNGLQNLRQSGEIFLQKLIGA